MNRPAWEKEDARVTSEVARRAIRRLDFLEWVILAAAVGLALGGGALVAWILAGSSSGNFRMVWMITSALLFIVPGAIVFARNKRDERREAQGSEDG
ncbi:MAG: hypothetical protein OEO79_06355 [Gemmatimonadota bacterium]|nr:hypothetical protein [Gemmatimonadota bacterium]